MLNFPGGPECRFPHHSQGWCWCWCWCWCYCYCYQTSGCAIPSCCWILMVPRGDLVHAPFQFMAICLALPWSTSLQELLVASALHSLPHHTSHLNLGLKLGSVWITGSCQQMVEEKKPDPIACALSLCTLNNTLLLPYLLSTCIATVSKLLDCGSQSPHF